MHLSPTTLDALRRATGGQRHPGGPQRFVRLFQPRFAELVASGRKLQTIRPLPKRIPFPGDHLSLRTWTGLPYRSPQRVLLDTTLASIQPVRIQDDGIYKAPEPGSLLHAIGVPIIRLHGESADRFAVADGFDHWPAMHAWFQAEHGLPFDGVLLTWEPTSLGLCE